MKFTFGRETANVLENECHFGRFVTQVAIYMSLTKDNVLYDHSILLPKRGQRKQLKPLTLAKEKSG